jgi:hypothetical protein
VILIVLSPTLIRASASAFTMSPLRDSIIVTAFFSVVPCGSYVDLWSMPAHWQRRDSLLIRRP